MRTRMYSGDPLGLDTMAKGIKTTLNGLNGELSPKAMGLPPITQIASLNLEGCWDAIKGNILTGCGANTAKAAVKATSGNGWTYSECCECYCCECCKL